VAQLLLLPIVLMLNTGATTVRGEYVEARTCDVYTGSCFANADTGLIGKNGVLAWKIDAGTVAGTKLDGLGVVAVVASKDTLGLKQSAPGRGIVIVDAKATAAQRAPFDLTICHCDGEGCAILKAGDVKIATRCIDVDHDKGCGNETTMYPPLAKGVSARAAVAAEHSFTGKGLNETWNDAGRRGAFVGTFVTR
jgi:uncharacterized protein DUF1326